MKKPLAILSIAFFTSITFFHFSCTQSQGNTPAPTATSSSVISDKVAVLRDGFNGYTGTKDTTIAFAPADLLSLGIFSAASTNEKIGTFADENLVPWQRAIGLISFDVSGLTTDMLESGETCASKIEVMQAKLDLWGNTPSGRVLKMEVLNSTAPAWTESGATFTSANGTDNWNSSSDPSFGPIMGDVNNEYNDATGGISESNLVRNFSFQIPADAVLDWVCDSNKNKGVIIYLNYGTNADKSTFYSREFAIKSYRPMLTLYLKRKN